MAERSIEKGILEEVFGVHFCENDHKTFKELGVDRATYMKVKHGMRLAFAKKERINSELESVLEDWQEKYHRLEVGKDKQIIQQQDKIKELEAAVKTLKFAEANLLNELTDQQKRRY